MPYLGKEPARVPVTAADIPDDSITAAKILDGVITAEDIGAGEVDTAELANDAVTEDKLADAINTAIAANTAKVTNATHTGDVTGSGALTIATDAVDIAMLSATGTASSSTFLRGDNSWVTPTDTNTVFDPDGAQVFNESGADVDFRVESDTDANSLFVQGSDGNVGIGVASPSAKIDIADSSIAALLGSSSGTTRADATSKVARVGVVHYTNAQEPVGFLYGQSTASKNQIAIGGGTASVNAATEINFWTAADQTTTTGTERMRIDSSGNVGIGVTPESWDSSYVALEVANLSLMARTGGDDTYLSSNAYYDGAWKYKTTDPATRHIMNNGTHTFNVAASGTADAAITFTTAMTIDNDGYVTKPSQPSFMAKLPAVTGTGFTITWGETLHNIGSCFNTSTGLFTAPVSGVYHFSFAILIDYMTPYYHRLLWKINGTDSTTWGDTLEQQQGDDYSSATMSVSVYMSANDTIGVMNSGADTYGTAYGSFSGHLIG
jgi:hypothetical protein